jgi:hypothetical protein
MVAELVKSTSSPPPGIPCGVQFVALFQSPSVPTYVYSVAKTKEVKTDAAIASNFFMFDSIFMYGAIISLKTEKCQ